MGNEDRSALAQVIESYRGNSIATVVIFTLLPVLLFLATIRVLLDQNVKFAEWMRRRYIALVMFIGVTLLKMRKFDKNKN